MTKTILVIDDSEIVLGVTRSLLEGAGYSVITHSRSTGSVALILQTKPDLVLLDVNMPSVRGDMVARMSSATRLATGTVVVLYSTLSEYELKNLASECGADGYVKKGGSPQALLRQVAGFVGDGSSSVLAASSRRGSAQVAPVQAATPPTDRSQDRTVLLVDRDMAELSRLRTMVQSLGYAPEFALSANQGLEKVNSSRTPQAIIASVDLPSPGVWSIFDAAVALDRTFLKRFVVISSLDTAGEFSPRFSGMVLTRPVAPGALQKVLDKAAPPVATRAAGQ